jgi:hypothetical protein
MSQSQGVMMPDPIGASQCQMQIDNGKRQSSLGTCTHRQRADLLVVVNGLINGDIRIGDAITQKKWPVRLGVVA